MTLREQVDGARLVMAYNDAGLTLAWHGGTGIRVYNDDGEEVDYFSVDCGKTNAEPEDVRTAMLDYMTGEGDDDDNT